MLSPGTLLLLGCFLLLAFLFFLRLATFDYFNRELFGDGFDSIEEVVRYPFDPDKEIFGKLQDECDEKPDVI